MDSWANWISSSCYQIFAAVRTARLGLGEFICIEFELGRCPKKSQKKVGELLSKSWVMCANNLVLLFSPEGHHWPQNFWWFFSHSNRVVHEQTCKTIKLHSNINFRLNLLPWPLVHFFLRRKSMTGHISHMWAVWKKKIIMNGGRPFANKSTSAKHVTISVVNVRWNHQTRQTTEQMFVSNSNICGLHTLKAT